MTDFVLVNDPDGVAALSETLAAAPWLALATEDNETHAYRARICLVQLNVAGRLYAIDTVALDGVPHPLAPLSEALSSAGLRKFLHGGEYTVAGFKRDYQIALNGIWDSQQAASLLGLERTGYRQLVREHLGVAIALPQSEIDWARRPLGSDALDYALSDVRHLPALAAVLAERIGAADLDDELDVAHQEVCWTSATIGRFDPERFHKLKGAHRLDERSLRVLRAVYLWRDNKARGFDRPPGRLIPNPSLIDLSRDPPRALAGLSRVRFHSQLLHDDRVELLAIIEAALTGAQPVAERVVRAPRSKESVARAVRLKVWRRGEAERRGVSLQAVLPRKALEWLARHGDAEFELADVPMLGQSRETRYGATLRELCGLTRPS